jgi:hypothetical protein
LGIAKDVPVKAGHHFISIDFVVLEMGESEKTPLILGRPFLKTVGATIDVGKGEIKFNINGERSSFKFRPRLEVCNMMKLNMFHLIIALLRKNQGRRKSRRRRK